MEQVIKEVPENKKKPFLQNISSFVKRSSAAMKEKVNLKK